MDTFRRLGNLIVSMMELKVKQIIFGLSESNLKRIETKYKKVQDNHIKLSKRYLKWCKESNMNGDI